MAVRSFSETPHSLARRKNAGAFHNRMHSLLYANDVLSQGTSGASVCTRNGDSELDHAQRPALLVGGDLDVALRGGEQDGRR